MAAGYMPTCRVEREGIMERFNDCSCRRYVPKGDAFFAVFAVLDLAHIFYPSV